MLYSSAPVGVIKANIPDFQAITAYVTMVNLCIHVLSNGDKYDIKNRKVSVLAIDAPFV